MKILKPGKVEQRKFVCNGCGCEFVAISADRSYSLGYYVLCPHCNNKLWWSEGEPYEEPTPTHDPQNDAVELYELMKESWPYSIGALSDFVDFLIAHGVTFREGRC